MSNEKPDTLIQSQGYVYKLLTSKEEQLEIDKRKEKERLANLGAFKAKIGTEQYEYLKSNHVVLEASHGRNYTVTDHYDFGSELHWWTDEYTTSDKKNFGDTEWYAYNGGELNNQYVTSLIHKAIQDYYFENFVTAPSKAKGDFNGTN